MIRVEQEALEHMKIKLEVLGIIGSLAIVSLGVSYKYILALVLSKELWNCTKL